MQRCKRDAVILGDIGGELRLVHVRQQQVGPVCKRRQRRAFLCPELANTLDDLGQRTDWI